MNLELTVGISIGGARNHLDGGAGGRLGAAPDAPPGPTLLPDQLRVELKAVLAVLRGKSPAA